MITLRKAAGRGQTQTDWLESYHSFSFGHYQDPQHMGFGVLRVINDDVVAPGAGFPPHAHRDMEIITHILSGVLEHKDSLGNGSLIRPGEAQCMSAGTGIRHSEYNPDAKNPVRLLQIWIEPHSTNLSPGYQQRDFAARRRSGKLTLLASPNGREESLIIHQDAFMHVLDLAKGQRIEIPLRGGFVLNGNITLTEGDGLAITDETALRLEATATAEALLFDLP